MSVVEARDLAFSLVGNEARRWEHVVAIAAAAEAQPNAGQLLVQAAWLHDIGYADLLRVTGCHHLDGAAYLRDLGHGELAALVAHHTSGPWEAPLRGLQAELDSFGQPDRDVLDVLTWLDLTVGPVGDRLTLPKRLDGVWARYGKEHVVTRGLEAAMPSLKLVVQRLSA